MSSSYTHHTATRDTILMAVHDQNFKNGAFKSQIPNSPPYLPTVNSFNVMINSDLLTATEKKAFVDARNAFSKLSRKLPEGCSKIPGIMDIFKIMEPMERVMDIFKADAKARGVYIPPMMMQRMKPDGTVGETHVLGDDGTVKVYKGDPLGVFPGAPKGFNENQNGTAKQWNDLNKAHGANAGVDLYNLAPTSDIKPSSKISDQTPISDTEKSTAEKEDDVDYGKGFSKNLRGAFM